MEAIRKMGEYEEYLRWHGFAERTIGSCAWVAAYFERTYRVISAKTLRTYRDFRRLEGYLRDGLLFLNRFGDPISKRGLACQLKARAAECGVDEGVVRPHAFRHLFARRFLGEGETSRCSPTSWAIRPWRPCACTCDAPRASGEAGSNA